MENNIKYSLISGILVVILALSIGLTVEWSFDKDHTTLYSDGEVVAKTRWSVESHRTWFALDSWYDRNVKCPKVISDGGRETETRCYYPADTYEQLSRSLIRTKITPEELLDRLLVTKLTPYYKYGTRGAYAGKVKEVFTFVGTDNEENFPESYTVDWKPTDTRKYKMIWRVWNLKEVDLPDGDYHDCSYKFGKVSINLGDDCSKLEKAVLKDDRIWFYFYPLKGDQTYDYLNLVDPIWQPNVVGPTGAAGLKGNVKLATGETENGSSIIASWHLNSNADDSSGNGFDGTVNGPTVTPDGKYLQAYEFDGVNSRISTSDAPDLASFSVSAWVYPTATASTNMIISRSTTTTENAFMLIKTSTLDSVRFQVNLQNGSLYKASKTNCAPINTWTHVVGTYDNDTGTANLFCDASDSGTTVNEAQHAAASAGDNFFIGTRADLAGDYTGTIDEVIVWNGTLSDQEIKELYEDKKLFVNTGESDNENDIIGLWHLNANALDTSGNGFDGTVSGAAVTEGRYLQAYDFNGSNNRIITSDAPDLQSFTVTLWMKQAKAMSTSDMIISRGTTTSGHYFTLMAGSNMVFQVNLANGTIRRVTNLAACNINRIGYWIHIAASYNNDTGAANLYCAGSASGSSFAGSSYTASTGGDNFAIGTRGDLNHDFNGTIDELIVWNKTLTSTEMSELINKEIKLVVNTGEVDIESSVVGLWHLNSGATDSSSGGNDGSVSGATLTPYGRYLTGYDFDGKNDVITISDGVVTIGENFTLSAWFKTNSTARGAIASPRGGRSGIFTNVDATGKVECRVFGGFPAFVSSVVDVVDNQWYHATCVYVNDDSGDSTSLYVNGEFVSSSGWYPSLTGTNLFYIGENPNTAVDGFFNGTIDEVTVWNRPLSAQEVWNLAR